MTAIDFSFIIGIPVCCPRVFPFFNLIMMKEDNKNNVKYHFVYKTTNLINGKWYIGKHSTSDLNDGYLGSSKHLKSAIKLYGKENFKRETLVFCDSEEEAYEKEAEFVTMEVVKNPMTYNKMLGGKGSQKRRTDDELKEHERECSRKWYQANKEYHREYQEAHREHIKEYQREWQEANREYKREYQRKWYQSNKERKKNVSV